MELHGAIASSVLVRNFDNSGQKYSSSYLAKEIGSLTDWRKPSRLRAETRRGYATVRGLERPLEWLVARAKSYQCKIKLGLLSSPAPVCFLLFAKLTRQLQNLSQ